MGVIVFGSNWGVDRQSQGQELGELCGGRERVGSEQSVGAAAERIEPAEFGQPVGVGGLSGVFGDAGQ